MEPKFAPTKRDSWTRPRMTGINGPESEIVIHQITSSHRTELDSIAGHKPTMLTNLRTENPEVSSAHHVADKHATIGPEAHACCTSAMESLYQ